tara:strand:+ start:127 stop:828 length:702 start_codon:yes stop_codon:yes gene_type:complete
MMTVLLTLKVKYDNRINDAPWYEFKEGVIFVLKHRIFRTLIILSWISMFFGTSYIQIMPLFAEMLQSGERGFGLLISATGVGSIIGNLFITRYQTSSKLGIMMLSSAAIAPCCLIGFSVITWILAGEASVFWIACGLAILSSAFSSVFLVSSMTVLQIKVPDAFRGRVMGIHSITFSMISLGGLAAGVLAAQLSAPIAVIMGALVVMSSVIWIIFKDSEIAILDLNIESKYTI